jgi:ElaB/YqjD/DUF883 family membrane-anchored ribosome-binding protein
MAERTNVAIQQRVRDEAPDRSADVIRQDIAAKRETISETVDKLGERIHETFDWREYVAEYPAVALGAAVGIGFVISGIFKRRPTPQDRIMDAVAELTEDMTDRLGGVMAGVIQKKVISKSTVKAAVGALATKAAVDFLKKQLSGALENYNSPGRARSNQAGALNRAR